jgi:predicted PurR-regulated permease PerM
MRKLIPVVGGLLAGVVSIIPVVGPILAGVLA